MNAAIRGKTVIVGIGSAGVGEVPGYSAIELLGQASFKVIADAGLKFSDIDAIFAATSPHAFPALSVTEYLGIRLKFVDGTDIGDSNFELHLLQAILALEAGLCDAALICYSSNQRTAGGRLISMSEPRWYETPYKPCRPITAHALAASWHMHQYGTTREQPVEVAVSARQWANLSPEALARGPLSVDDVLTARMISDPLSAADCRLVTDGGGACVVVRVKRARDLPNAPVYFFGAAGAQWHRPIVSMPDLTMTAASENAPRAIQMAGMRHADIDLVMLYNVFTINTLLFLEDLGSCAKGEGGPLVQGRRIAPGGELAVNTNGGRLSCVYPGMYGMFLIIEVVTQLHRQAGEWQLAKADVVLLHSNGGTLFNQITALFGTGDTFQTSGRQASRAPPWWRPVDAFAREEVVAPATDKRIRWTHASEPFATAHQRSPFRQSYSIDRTTFGRGNRCF